MNDRNNPMREDISLLLKFPILNQSPKNVCPVKIPKIPTTSTPNYLYRKFSKSSAENFPKPKINQIQTETHSSSTNPRNDPTSSAAAPQKPQKRFPGAIRQPGAIIKLRALSLSLSGARPIVIPNSPRARSSSGSQ